MTLSLILVPEIYRDLNVKGYLCLLFAEGNDRISKF